MTRKEAEDLIMQATGCPRRVASEIVAMMIRSGWRLPAKNER